MRTSGVLGLRVVQRTSLTFSTFCFGAEKNNNRMQIYRIFPERSEIYITGQAA